MKLSTPRARDVFNLLPVDVGRPLSDITSALVGGRLVQDAELVLEHLQTIEREVQTTDGRWYLTRVLPYRTTEDRIEGVVVTFLDITERRQAESMVRASEERLRLLIDSVKDYAIFTITADGRVDSWNAGAQRVFGYGEREIVGQPVRHPVHAGRPRRGTCPSRSSRARRPRVAPRTSAGTCERTARCCSAAE